MRSTLYSFIAIVLILGGLVILKKELTRRSLSIDKCLDLGGRWDVAHSICENH